LLPKIYFQLKTVGYLLNRFLLRCKLHATQWFQVTILNNPTTLITPQHDAACCGILLHVAETRWDCSVPPNTYPRWLHAKGNFRLRLDTKSSVKEQHISVAVTTESSLVLYRYLFSNLFISRDYLEVLVWIVGVFNDVCMKNVEQQWNTELKELLRRP
jgi:hypothetical protein